MKIVHARAGLALQGDALIQSAQNRWRPAWSSTNADFVQGDAAGSISFDEASTVYQDCLRRWHIRERFHRPDWSIVDLWVARRLLSERMPAAQVEAILELASPQFPRRHGNPRDYLRRTVARAATAFPPTGGAV